MTKGKRIKFLREQTGLSQVDLAKKISVSKQTLYKYENDIITNIPSDKIEAIAKVTNSNPEFIMGWEKMPNTQKLSPEEADRYGLLEPEIRTVPVLGKVACGEPLYAAEVISYVTIKDAPKNVDYALVASGDSMINVRIHDGDYVFFKEQNTVENGEIAVVLIEDSTTLKRVYFDKDKQTLTLMAENPQYPPLFYSGAELDQIRILGKAIAFQSVIV